MDWESYSEFKRISWFWGTLIVYAGIILTLILITVDKWWKIIYYPIYLIWYMFQVVPMIIGFCMFICSRPVTCPNDIMDLDNNSLLIKQLFPTLSSDSGQICLNIENETKVETSEHNSVSFSSYSDDGLTVIELDRQSPIGNELRTVSEVGHDSPSFSGSVHDRFIYNNLP